MKTQESEAGSELEFLGPYFRFFEKGGNEIAHLSLRSEHVRKLTEDIFATLKGREASIAEMRKVKVELDFA